MSKFKDKLGTPKGIFANLKEAFPDKLPRSEVSPHKLGELVGEQKVLRYLEGVLKSEELL